MSAEDRARVEFRLGGYGPYLRAYQDQCRRLDLDPWVVWLGFLSREEARREFHRCHCYALASHHESFGVVLVEAMASGKPAIFVRNQKKEYGSNKQIEGVYNTGETIIIVEDIMTTGGQVVEAAKTLESAGLKVKKIVGVIDRLEGARQNIEAAGYVFESLFTTKDLGVA